jgi:tRNA 2-thiouridine synthesizing protein A
MSIQFDQELDFTGLSCPTFILKTEKAVDGLRVSQVLKMIANDPGSLAEVQIWSTENGHELLGYEYEGGKFISYIKRTK